MKVFRETIVPSERESFLALLIEEPRFSCPFHYHPQLELSYITRSSGTRIIGDHISGFIPGDLCLIGENLPHTYSNPGSFQDGAIAEVLQFDREVGHGLLDNTPELSAFSRLMDGRASAWSSIRKRPPASAPR